MVEFIQNMDFFCLFLGEILECECIDLMILLGHSHQLYYIICELLLS